MPAGIDVGGVGRGLGAGGQVAGGDDGCRRVEDLDDRRRRRVGHRGHGDDLSGCCRRSARTACVGPHSVAVIVPWNGRSSSAVLDLVLPVQDVAGDGVDHAGVGEGRARLRRRRRWPRRPGGRVPSARARARSRTCCSWAKPGTVEPGPAAGRRPSAMSSTVGRRRRRGRRCAAALSQPSSGRERRRPAERRSVLVMRRGDVGDLAVRDADGDHARRAAGARPPKRLAEQHRAGVAVGELLVVDQLEVVDLVGASGRTRRRGRAARRGRATAGSAEVAGAEDAVGRAGSRPAYRTGSSAGRRAERGDRRPLGGAWAARCRAGRGRPGRRPGRRGVADERRRSGPASAVAAAGWGRGERGELDEAGDQGGGQQAERSGR